MAFFTMRRINILIGLLVVVGGVGLLLWLKFGGQPTPVAQPPQTSSKVLAQNARNDEQKKDIPGQQPSRLPPEVSQAIAQGGPAPGEVRQPIAPQLGTKPPLPAPPPPSVAKEEKTPPPPSASSAPLSGATSKRQEYGPPPDMTPPAQPAAPSSEPKTAQSLDALTVPPSKENAPLPSMSALSQTLHDTSKKTKKSQKAGTTTQPASKETPAPPLASPSAPASESNAAVPPRSPVALKEQKRKDAERAPSGSKNEPGAALGAKTEKKPSDKKATLQAPKAAKKTPSPASPSVATPSHAAIRQSGQVASLSLPFSVGRIKLNRSERRALRAFVKPLQGRIESVQVDGHTCTLGSTEVNQRISEQRAASVALLIRRLTGLDESRIQVKGYGETKPLCDAETPLCRKKNRRVEITLALRGVSMQEGAPSAISAHRPGESLSPPSGPVSPRTAPLPKETPAAVGAPATPSPRRTQPRGEFGPEPKAPTATDSTPSAAPKIAFPEPKETPGKESLAPPSPKSGTPTATPASKPDAGKGKNSSTSPTPLPSLSRDKTSQTQEQIPGMPVSDVQQTAPALAPLSVILERQKALLAPKSGLAGNKASARAAAYGLTIMLTRGQTRDRAS
jgi:outer membrane protein OmpA-like peptidoglycan-associated protein